MEWNRDTRAKLFGFLWRTTVVLLPWQTRFFWDAQLAGWPWEQGRISVYLSWLPLLGTMLVGLGLQDREIPNWFRRVAFWTILFLGLCTLAAAPSPSSVAIQWWVQVFLLSAFFITLYRARVDSREAAGWFLVSLFPQALLAICQTIYQVVWASKWLGVAAQWPANLGVSVVQGAAGRFLRAYGGFPHPNILGGWMAFGLIVSVAWRQKRHVLYGILSSIFAFALFFSFSRSAWLAVALGFLLFGFQSFRAKSSMEESKKSTHQSTHSPSIRDDRRGLLIRLFVPLAVFMILVLVHSDLVFTRIQASERLEQKSVATRLQTLRDGVEVYRSNIVFGTGPNSELSTLALIRGIKDSPAPLEPPHMVWLLALVNFGAVGALFMAGFGLVVFRRLLEKWDRLDKANKSSLLSWLAMLIVLGSLDHYLWSYWSGQSLAFMILGIIGLGLSQNPGGELTLTQPPKNR